VTTSATEMKKVLAAKSFTTLAKLLANQICWKTCDCDFIAHFITISGGARTLLEVKKG